MTEQVCVPWNKQPGFGGGPGRNCRLVDARVVYHEKYSARTLLRGPGEEDIEAYSYDGKGSLAGPFRVGTKSRDKFAKHATEFEKYASVLLKPKPKRFHVSAYTKFYADPVIDKDYVIIGHYGWFKGDEIYVHNSAPRSRGQGELYVEFGLQQLLDQGAPVFIGNRDAKSYRWATDDEKFLLLTDVHGQVLMYTGYDLIGLQSAEEALLVIGLAYAAAKLIAHGAEAGVRSLIRNFGKRAGKGSFGRPALPAKVIWGKPPQVNVGRFGRPGNLFGQLEIRQGEVVYNVKSIILRGANTADEWADLATARLAHREMIMRAAEEAKQLGKRQFKLRGTDANGNFRAHADKLADEVGIAKSGTVLPGSAPGFSSYEVRLDVAKVLAQQ